LWVLYATGEGVCDTCDGGDVFTSVGEAFRGCVKVFKVVRRPPKNFGDVRRPSEMFAGVHTCLYMFVHCRR
jgi:hypothetical protein